MALQPTKKETLQPTKTDTSLVDKNSLSYKRNRDREMVRGKFIFHEVAGGELKFSIKLYKDDQVENFTMVDGQIYTIPRGVAKHLNTNLWYPVHGFTVDENGKPVSRIGQKVRRCSFQSLEFMDDDTDLIAAPPIITVESLGL